MNRVTSISMTAAFLTVIETLYFSTYVKLNPITIPRFFANVEEPIATADLVPYDEFIQTRFYREWARPQDSGRFPQHHFAKISRESRDVRRVPPCPGWPRR